MPTTLSLRMRLWVLFAATLLAALTPRCIIAQSESASVSGRVTDQQNALIPEVEVELRNVDTGVSHLTKTNGDGFYSFPAVKPGTYVMSVRKQSFQTVSVTGMTLNVQDNLSRNFVLQIGSSAVSVTVTADQNNINTIDASVSTVIDRQFVSNLPLNGRSFNTLVQLAPGVVTTEDGKGYSINGQRTTTNYYTVDGVSANFGASTIQRAVGTAPSFTTAGGANSLVSIDALQEFRVQTSSFAPEYGRTPGGQIEVSTRSGTNAFHGDVFDYLRNNALDANDWFYDQAVHQATPGSVIPKPQLRQNDFGATIGGPIIQDRTFFFLSYEGLRLTQPEVQLFAVPNVQTRQSVPAPLNQLLNAFPEPNGADNGDGTAAFTQTTPSSQSLDAGSVRIDHRLNSTISLFVRANFAPSRSTTQALNAVTNSDYPTYTGTAGLNAQISNNVVDQLRFNYSSSEVTTRNSLSSSSGAIVPDISLLLPSPLNANSDSAVFLFESSTFAHFPLYNTGAGFSSSVGQFNLVDNVAVTAHSHFLKFGVDFKRLNLSQYTSSGFVYICSANNLSAGSCGFVIAASNLPAHSKLTNWSFYGQDTWRIMPKLVLTYGIRWDINGAPTATSGGQLAVASNVATPSSLSIAPSSRLWATQYDNFAPRLGVAFSPFASGRIVIRGGVGTFYDLGTSASTGIGSYFPYSAQGHIFGPSLPLSDPQQYLVPPSFNNPPYQSIGVVGNNFTTPYSLQWNVAVESSLSRSDVLTATYLGQSGRQLLRTENLSSPTPQIQEAIVTENGSSSNYNALQIQYRRKLFHGLQALANYAWSHSLDNQSIDQGSIPFALYSITGEYGNSSFDVRHNFSSALTYDVPTPSFHNQTLKMILGGWGIDSTVYLRSGFPIDVTQSDPNSQFLHLGESRPDRVAGEPLWIASPGGPDGNRVNPAAFTFRDPTRQGTLGRNAVPGLGMTQWDMSVRKAFPISEKLRLVARLDAFNILNHPNFTNPTVVFSSGSATDPMFGEATQMLNQSLFGSPLYSSGGPRSLQISLKLSF